MTENIELLPENDRHFKGQWGCDRALIDQLLKEGRIQPEIFLEIGAYDGVQWSNCFYLEKIMGWTGVCIEPILARAAECGRNRWNPVVSVAISYTESKSMFNLVEGYAEALSGLKDLMPQQTIDRIQKEIASNGGKLTQTLIDTIPLDRLLRDIRPTYLSLDVQGGEFEILKHTNPSLLPDFISFDTNGQNNDTFKQLMEGYNYILVWKATNADEFLWKKSNSMGL